MYLIINNNQYTVTRRIVSSDTLKYLGVTPGPGEVTGTIEMHRDDGFLLSEDDADNYERQSYSGTLLTLTNRPEPTPPEPVPYVWHATQEQMDASVKLASRSIMTMSLSADETIEVAALYPEWTLGEYAVGDIRLAYYEGTHQPWKCRQAHDTTTYPEITPDGTAWRTFWVPFHGTSPDTAQAWIAPTMAEDMYHVGEYMIWTDGETYRCTQDTDHSPEDYPQAWTVVEDE